jgi:hydroxyacid-oxoacid transhydrogenase
MVAACSGLDVLSHALESYTALPYHQRPAPAEVKLRPAYQGANPISDIWAARAIELCARYLVRAVQDPSDDEARGQMILAAAFAGIGFGNAGVHLPHGMSYPISGLPTRHLEAARLLGANVVGAGPEDAGEVLAAAIVEVMRQTGMPNGLRAVGITEGDLDVLVEGTLPQHRVTKLSPRPADREALRALFTASMAIW